MAVIPIPAQFEGVTLSRLIDRLVAHADDEGLPAEIDFDFSRLTFIEPTGVVFLSNLIHWLVHEGCRVSLSGCERYGPALRFLDDSLFFMQHSGRKQQADASPRATTRPLQRVASDNSHPWLELNFVPWLAGRLGIPRASLSPLKTCISELFNNIKDHTQFEIGSIFAQHYPQRNQVVIAVSDFGSGIPHTVRRTTPDLSDEDAIALAVREGFSTHSIPTNQGIGLDYLMRTVVLGRNGTVTIYSAGGIVEFSRGAAGLIAHPLTGVGYCPGTTFEICLPTDMIEIVPDEQEDLEW